MTDMDFRNKKTLKVSGGQKPNGTVKVSGAKNAATRLMAASLLTRERVTLYNFPTELVDARYKADFMQEIGASVTFDSKNAMVTIHAEEIYKQVLNDYSYPIRTTYLLAAGQLNRNGVARIPFPGGCKIGDRKYDLHIMVWEAMGCKVEERENHIEIRGRLKPAEINFPISTIGGTENALICGAGIEGTTTVRNAYISPEVYCLIEFLNSLGAKIKTTGNSFISITGNPELRGSTFSVIPDRIEAVTWIIFGALSQGSIIIENVPFQFMESPFIHLRESGLDVYKNSSNVHINKHCMINDSVQPFEMACGTYPGIISDMQPFFTLLGLKAQGISRIYDYRYPDRTAYLAELSKFCPDALSWEPGKITINGPAKFQAADVVSTDLRGSMGMVMAALLAEGTSTVSNVGMALRGYDNMLEKLKILGIECELMDGE